MAQPFGCGFQTQPKGRATDGASQDLRHLIRRERDRVAFHAAGFGSAFHQRRHVARLDAVGTQRRDAQRPAHLGDPRDAVFRRGVRASGQDLRDPGIAIQRFTSARAQCADVYLHRKRQQRRADRAVRRVEGPPDGRGKPVDGAQSRVGQAQPAEQAGQRHVLAGFAVPAIGIGANQRARGPLHAFLGVKIRHRICADRDERLDQLRQRVEPRAGGERGRQLERQFRIHHRQPRQHQRAAQAGLDAVLGRGENRVARDFRSRARGGRNSDERRRRLPQRLPAADDLEVVERIAAVAEHGRNRLARVDRTAASEAHHHVALLGAGQLRAATDQIDGRLAFDPQHGFRQVQRGAVRHQQRAPSHLPDRRRHLLKRARAEDNPCCGGELEPHHQPSSAGKMFEYFTAVRGSAIISATASRQVA